MKVAILSANLGNFDKPVPPVDQIVAPGIEVSYHCFTDKDFPQIADLPPRFQYRIPKLFSWEMYPGYDIYIWLDGGMSLQDPHAVMWLLEQLGEADIAFFKHPWRNTVKEECDHIEEYLQKGDKYITSRYKNGLHKEMYEAIQQDISYTDEYLFASTVFIYKNIAPVKSLMEVWWYFQSRYYTCDQLALPYAMFRTGITFKQLEGNVFKNKYITNVSPHK